MNLRLISYKTNKMTKGSFMYAEKIEYDDIEMSSRFLQNNPDCFDLVERISKGTFYKVS